MISLQWLEYSVSAGGINFFQKCRVFPKVVFVAAIMRCALSVFGVALCAGSWPAPQSPGAENDPAVEVSSFPAALVSPLSSSARPSIRVKVQAASTPNLRVKRKIDQIFQEQEKLQESVAAQVGALVKEGVRPSFSSATEPVSEELRLAASSVPYPTVAEVVAEAIRKEQAAFAQLVMAADSRVS